MSEKKLLTKKEAIKYSGLKTKSHFEQEVNAGRIGFKYVGKVKKYLPEEIDRWRNNLNYTLFTNVKGARTGGSDTRLKSDRVKEFSLEKVQKQLISMKHSVIVCKESANSNEIPLRKAS